jgi:hypothetical protein
MEERNARSRKQERDWAIRWGGQTTPGSGRGELFKADFRTAKHLIELKYTKAQQFTLKLADLGKIEEHALMEGRDPVYGIEFMSMPLSTRKDGRYVVLPEWDYLSKLERLAEQDAEIDRLNALVAEREAIIRATLPIVVPGPDGLIHGSTP